MLISPQYRAQEQQGFKFEGLFGRTEEGVVFSGTFLGEFDVGKLAGNKLGCGFNYSESLKPNRAWDVITTVSERVVTAGGPGEVVTYNPKSGAVTTVVPKQLCGHAHQRRLHQPDEGVGSALVHVCVQPGNCTRNGRGIRQVADQAL
jgi:hypothetical protein